MDKDELSHVMDKINGSTAKQVDANEAYIDNGMDEVGVSSIATKRDLLNMTSNVVAAYLGNHKIDEAEVSSVIDRVYRKLTDLNANSPPLAPSFSSVQNHYQGFAQRPAVDIDKSVQDDYIICLEDGVKLKMLKRHLRTAYRMTPEQYRVKWGLPSDYPMVAPNYARVRSGHAKRIGLGRKPKSSPLD